MLAIILSQFNLSFHHNFSNNYNSYKSSYFIIYIRWWHLVFDGHSPLWCLNSYTVNKHPFSPFTLELSHIECCLKLTGIFLVVSFFHSNFIIFKILMIFIILAVHHLENLMLPILKTSRRNQYHKNDYKLIKSMEHK